MVESGELDGYYDVKSVSIGLVLSTSTCTTHDLTPPIRVLSFYNSFPPQTLSSSIPSC